MMRLSFRAKDVNEKTMNIRTICYLLVFGALTAQLTAQSTAGSVSYQYQGTALRLVLEDLQQRHQLRFTYSPSRLPMDWPVYAQAERLAVPKAMERLFAETPIQYSLMGDQIVLRTNPAALTRLEMRKQQPKQHSPLYGNYDKRMPVPVAPTLPTHEPRMVSGGDRWLKDKLEAEELDRITRAMERHDRELAADEYDATHRLAQISILPYLGTNTYRSHEVTNTLSLNVFWGTSKAIDGFEFGGVANSVVTDMSGCQIAGAVNQVGGAVSGVQIAGGVNYVAGKVSGTQIAGLVNVNQDSLTGAQIAGLANVSAYHVNGAQVSGLFNSSRGDVETQVSSLFNRARYVGRRQVALVNVCDTTAKAPYGLLNIVRYGYNRVEVGATEALFANLGAKLGTRQLYNIFQLGLRWDNAEQTVDGVTSQAAYTSWALGYGLGVGHRLGGKTLLNTEAVALHVNEMEAWTDQLNLMAQLRITLDFQIGGRWSLYAGPTLNRMWSRRYDPLTQTHGSVLPHQPQWTEQRGDTHIATWIGFSAGIRL